jgi:hypothetical protein
MYTHRLIFLFNYLVLAASGAYGFDSPRLGVFLRVGIALFGALFALLCVSLGIVCTGASLKNMSKRATSLNF